MMSAKIKNLLSLLRQVSIIKTIRVNFTQLPPPQALRFPILISRHTYLRSLKGKISIVGGISRAMIRIGFDTVGIFDYKKSRSILEIDGELIFKGRTHIGNGAKLSVLHGGTIELDENFDISGESTVLAGKHISFGKGVLLSWDILVMDTDFHKIVSQDGAIINPNEDIVIGDNVWIACRSTILKGVNIPDGCVIGADSLVNKSFTERNVLIAGHPAKIVKTDIKWER